jgi:hypothetical protein
MSDERMSRAQEIALQLGHDVESDPPFMSSASRWTCKRCGRAVLQNGRVVYGQASEERCEPIGAES